MIRAVLFDYGGVLTEGGKTGSIRAAFARMYGVDVSRIPDYPLGSDALQGLITDDEFIAAANKRYPGLPKGTVQGFVAAGNIYHKALPVYKLAEKLRAHGIKTAILSNMLEANAKKLQAEGCYTDFAPVLLSCREHHMKPQPAFYQLAIDKLGVPSQNIVFIDDVADYLQPAQELGMHTILAVSSQQIVADVADLVRKENGISL